MSAALVLVLGLSGCSDSEAEPKTLPPVSTPSPTAAPVPSPPAEAAAETPDGASAFARYYHAMIDDAFRRGDPAGLMAISASDCGGCNDIIESVRKVAARGERQRDGGYQISSVVSPPVENGDVVLLVDFTVSRGSFIDTAGQVASTTAPEPRTTAQMRLVRRGRSWIVQGYRIAEGG